MAASLASDNNAPSLHLCTRAWRVMTVYAALANDALDTAWRACIKPTDVVALLPHLQPWECEVSMFRPNARGALEMAALQLAKHLRNLRRLDLGSEYSRSIESRLLCACLSRMSMLAHLNLANRQLDDADVAILQPAFTHLSRLRSLNLSYNVLRPAACEHLRRCLARTRGLEELLLASARINGDGLTVLEPALKQLSQLHLLALSGNPADFKGCAALARVLSHERTHALQELRWAYAGMKTDALRGLLPAFEHLQNLHTLVICGNPLGPKGCEMLASGLSRARVCASVDASSIGLASHADAPGKPALRAALPPGCRVHF